MRPFREGDANAIQELHERALRAAGAHGGSGPWDDDLDRINHVYVRPGGCFLEEEEDGTIIGMGALKRHPNGDGEIKRMRVDPRWQRRGIGQEILTALLKAAKERGMRRIYLDTTDRQAAARRLYEKNGFREFGRNPWRGMTLVFYERIEPGKAADGIPGMGAPGDGGCG